MNHFTEALGLSRYTLYMHDYGGPVGFRMALAHPERVDALIVQDAAGHNEGLGANWKTRREFWRDRAAHERCAAHKSAFAGKRREPGTSGTIQMWIAMTRILWTDEYYFLNQPGQAEIQSDLFYDYQTNVDAYPKWQAWMRAKHPRLLVIWGKYDLSFDSWRAGTLPQGRAECGSARSRRRAFRIGHGCRSDCEDRPGFHEVALVTGNSVQESLRVPRQGQSRAGRGSRGIHPGG